MKYVLDNVVIYKWPKILLLDFWFPKIRDELGSSSKKKVGFGIRQTCFHDSFMLFNFSEFLPSYN